MENPRAVVTGANGFLGQAIVRAFLAAGWDVQSWVREHSRIRDTSAREVVWRTPYTAAGIAQVLHDNPPRVIVHCAGPADVHAASLEPANAFVSATAPFGGLLEGIRLSSTRCPVVLISSAAIYGEPKTLPITERTPARPISAYGYTKLHVELLAQQYAELHDIPVMVSRLFSTFGAAQHRLLVWDLARQLLDGRDRIILRGTGREERDYLYVEDAALYVRAMAAALSTLGGGYHVYNVASGRSITTGDLARLIAKHRGLPASSVDCQNRETDDDPKAWAVDVTKLVSRFGEPRFSLEESLSLCLAEWGVPRAVP